VTVSIVLCAYNPREDWLHDAVASVLADEAELELVVVDDGSDVPVAEVLHDVDDPRVRHVRIEHGGLSRARNAGIRAARGEYVRFADADDLVTPYGTSALLALADAQTVTYGATELCDEAMGPYGVKRSSLAGWVAEDCLLYRFDVVHTSMLFPRHVLEQVGEFDTELRQCQDWDFVLRACEVAPVRGTEEIVTRYRRHGSSTSANVVRALEFESKVVDRYFARHPEQAGTRLEREARAKLLLVRARVARGRREQLRLVAAALRLSPRRTLREVRDR
jgi:glycosyltransferase involved in cell wall biosynthesis